MREKGYVSRSQEIAEAQGHRQAQNSLDLTKVKRHVLVAYTRDKRLKELRSEVEKARAEELSRQADWELEGAKEAELEREPGRVER